MPIVTSFSSGDSCSMLLDTDNHTLSFFKDGKLNGDAVAFTNLPAVPLRFAVNFLFGGSIDMTSGEADLQAYRQVIADTNVDTTHNGNWWITAVDADAKARELLSQWSSADFYDEKGLKMLTEVFVLEQTPLESQDEKSTKKIVKELGKKKSKLEDNLRRYVAKPNVGILHHVHS